jgi:superfamily I DNA and/or RNA helicase
MQRGANIVFATCATATPRNLGTTGGASSFDWVIVEEAAKAWPTELAIPLVRGTRWTLIGDHFQLPAHRRDEVVRFLDSCVNDPSTAIAAAGADRKTYLKAFDLFGSLFPEEDPTGGPARDPDGDEDSGRAWRERPTARLSTQFRMREPIAQVVSRVFYPRAPRPGERPPDDGMPLGGLATHHPETPAPLEAPGRLRGRALVWLDTAGLPNCQEQPYWKNEGEADIVHRLVSAMRPAPVPGRDGFSTEPLAVLTPYRQQAEVLHRYGDLSRFVQTVHAFQGREADIVVVSLVRNKRRGSGSAAESFGHLSRQDLINVLFSRARQLLVIVGEYAHYAGFENGGDTFWQSVCQAVDHYGVVLNAADVLSLEAS